MDAKVALSFHLQREAAPDQFKNRFVNFLWYVDPQKREKEREREKQIINLFLPPRYTKFGASAMFDGCESLQQEIKLEVDEKNVEIPAKLQGLIVVNLPSYAAGLNMWRGDIPEGMFLFFLISLFFSSCCSF